LRRYNLAGDEVIGAELSAATTTHVTAAFAYTQAGAYTPPLLGST